MQVEQDMRELGRGQYISLDSITKSRSDNDRIMAAQALIEGQATFEQLSAMLGGGNMFTRMPGGWDRVRQMIRDSQGSMPVFGTAPMFIQEALLFPYLSGAEFMRQFKEKRPGQSVLDFVPVSTEQVLHPERLLDSLDVPLRVTLPRPQGGTVVYENGLGEFETRLVLFQQVKDAEVASRAARGWGGDRYMVVNTPQGAGLWSQSRAKHQRKGGHRHAAMLRKECPVFRRAPAVFH